MLFRTGKKHVVYTVGAPVLREIAKPVLAVDPGIIELAQSMMESLRIFNGIGLAAPQVGESLRLVVFDVPPNEEGGDSTPGEAQLLPRMPIAVINPEIVAASGEMVTGDEGCLSVPDIFAPVTRPSRVVFRATTLAGEMIECECGGLLARCIQHELDHLDGKIFLDRVTPEEEKKIHDDVARLVQTGRARNYCRIRRK